VNAPVSLQHPGEVALLKCRRLTIAIKSTWGDKHYVGLTGIQVLLGPSLTPVKLCERNIQTTPLDLSVLGVAGDPRVNANLIDEVNETTDDTHMWLTPFTPGSEHTVSIDLECSCAVAGIRFWNYNKTPEDTQRGAKLIE
jgi:hypothetical protein